MSIDAMTQALDALEHEAQKGNDDAYRVERDALRAAIEQANEFNPDWDALAVMVEEQQRMAKRIEELEGKPNYATPEQPRQWQGLTEQEIKDCEKQAMVNGALPFEQRSFFARAIEAKLKEKNT